MINHSYSYIRYISHYHDRVDRYYCAVPIVVLESAAITI